MAKLGWWLFLYATTTSVRSPKRVQCNVFIAVGGDPQTSWGSVAISQG
jgi:hypothetical protein